MIGFTKLTDLDCKRLASEIYSGDVFCNFMIPEEDMKLVQYVFEPIMTEEFVTFISNNQGNIGLLYEYYNKASVKKLFKYNVFFTMKILDLETAKVVSKYLQSFRVKQK